jgi:hypothetical protein
MQCYKYCFFSCLLLFFFLPSIFFSLIKKEKYNNMPTIKIGDYLLKRLKEINIETVFGVPGDYNMVNKTK